MNRVAQKLLLLCCSLVIGTSSLAANERTIVAVAANFTAPVREISKNFQEETGHKITLSFGSTGTLYNQIKNGAPFAAFLAADEERPRKAIQENLAIPDSLFIYATGTLVLHSTDPAFADLDASVLNQPEQIEKLAIANPKMAPYGFAAVEALKRLGAYDGLNSKLILGNNIAQAYQFVATGNATLGLVAKSQLKENNSGATWILPKELYPPIHQAAVLLTNAKDNQTARDFLDYLKSEQALTILKKYGYEIP